jgi:heme exporter protein A
MMLPALQVNHLGKAFGRQKVLNDINFSLAPGEILAICGTNGAGKTTLLNVLATLLRADSGEVVYFGRPLPGNENMIRRRIGVVSHQTMLYNDLTAGENLMFFAKIYQLDEPAQMVEKAFNEVGLTARRNQIVRTLSRGMQQRLTIARAILHDPDLLLMDEPFSSLDQQSEGSLFKMIDTMAAGGRSVFFVSHDLSQIARTAHRALFLSNGKIMDELKKDDLTANNLSAHYRDLMEKGRSAV